MRSTTRRHSQTVAPDFGGQLALGALAGAAAVFVLDRVDWALYLSEDAQTRAETARVRPGGEPPAHVAATMIEDAVGADLSADPHARAGNVVHYAIGIAPAALYAAFKHRAPWLTTGRGALFGAAMYLAQDQGLNTVSGLGADPRRYPWQDHARGLVAHVAYGLALDLFVRLLEGRRDGPEGTAYPLRGDPHAIATDAHGAIG